MPPEENKRHNLILLSVLLGSFALYLGGLLLSIYLGVFE